MFGMFANPMRFAHPIFYPSSNPYFVNPWVPRRRSRFGSRSFLPLLIQSQLLRDYNNYLFDLDDLDFPNFGDVDPNNKGFYKHRNNNNKQTHSPQIYEHHKKFVSDSTTGVTKEVEIQRIGNKWVERHSTINKDGQKTETTKVHEDEKDHYGKVIQQFIDGPETIPSLDLFYHKFNPILDFLQAISSNLKKEQNQLNASENSLSEQKNLEESQNNNNNTINEDKKINSEMDLEKNINILQEDESDQKEKLENEKINKDTTEELPQIKDPSSSLSFNSTPENYPKTTRKPKSVIED